MKNGLSTQLGQQLHLTPQLLQSIRLLQLDGLQLEQEIRRLLEQNPALELDESQQAEIIDAAAPVVAEAAAQDVAAFDELPESSMWDVAGGELVRRRRRPHAAHRHAANRPTCTCG